MIELEPAGQIDQAVATVTVRIPRLKRSTAPQETVIPTWIEPGQRPLALQFRGVFAIASRDHRRRFEPSSTSRPSNPPASLIPTVAEPRSGDHQSAKVHAGHVKKAAHGRSQRLLARRSANAPMQDRFHLRSIRVEFTMPRRHSERDRFWTPGRIRGSPAITATCTPNCATAIAFADLRRTSRPCESVSGLVCRQTRPRNRNIARPLAAHPSNRLLRRVRGDR